MTTAYSRLRISTDEWLTRILGYPAISVEVPAGRPEENVRAEEIQPLRHALARAPLFAFCKMPTFCLLWPRTLARLGFYIVDTTVVFEAAHMQLPSERIPLAIRQAVPSDEEQVAALARTCFIFDRFHTDPEISPRDADRIKEEWARGFFKGARGTHMVVACASDTVAGFVLLILQNDILTVDLIAVREDMRGEGIAPALLSHAHQKFGGKIVRAGTQIANIPAVRMYEKLGFAAVSSHYVFHYHNRRG